MPGMTLAKADGILRDLYTDLVIEQTNYRTYMLDTVERSSDHITGDGKKAVFSVESAPNPSRGSIDDGGTLPAPDSESYDDAIVFVKHHAGGFEITDQAWKQGKNRGIAGVTSLLERGTKATVKSFKKNINRQIWGDGTGLLGKVAAAANSATQTLDTVQFVKIGDPVDVLTRSNGAVVSASRKVTGRSASAKTITLDAAVNATANEGIYLEGSYGREMEGMLKIAATGRTLHGIDSTVAGNEYWNAYVKVKSAAAGPNAPLVGENDYADMIDAVGAGGQDEVGMIITTRGMRNRLARQYQSQRRLDMARPVDIHGGYNAIFVNEVPITYDDDAPKGVAVALPNNMDDTFLWHEVEQPDWLESPDGTVWHLANSTVAGKKRTAWQAWFVWYASLGATAPNRTGAITGGQDDDPV